MLQTPSLKFTQGQIRLRPNPPAQSSVMFFQTGTPITADLLGPALASLTVLLPKAFHAFTADTKTPTHFAGARPVVPAQR
ncbi:MAG: hypothetical protein WDM76_12075 [Limisphaerales bacterium]